MDIIEQMHATELWNDICGMAVGKMILTDPGRKWAERAEDENGSLVASIALNGYVGEYPMRMVNAARIVANEFGRRAIEDDV